MIWKKNNNKHHNNALLFPERLSALILYFDYFCLCFYNFEYVFTYIHLFKVNIWNTRKGCEISSKLTKIPERCQWRRSAVFIHNFEHISYLFLVFLLLTLSKYLFAVLGTEWISRAHYHKMCAKIFIWIFFSLCYDKLKWANQ